MQGGGKGYSRRSERGEEKEGRGGTIRGRKEEMKM